jgi:subtilisin family serine protease
MIDFANSRRQKLIINMSLMYSLDPNFERLVANNSNNALFVIATGNEDRNSLSYPAILAQRFNNVIAVGASWGTLDRNGILVNPGTRISYPGPNGWGSNYGSGITLMSPSEVITTNAVPNSLNRNISGFNFNYEFNGTSAATPNVAGVASLVWSANPNLSAVQIKQILSETAFDLGQRGYDTVYGHGFVNADAAVRRALAM